jgi:hypothetical protein
VFDGASAVNSRLTAESAEIAEERFCLSRSWGDLIQRRVERVFIFLGCGYAK